MISHGPTGIVIVTHGDYGPALVATAEQLVGPLAVGVVAISTGTSPQDIRELLAAELGCRDCGHGVLVLTDLCGSTPANICLSLLAGREASEMITGLSLAMLMKLATCNRSVGARTLARQLQGTAQRSIIVGTELQRNGGCCGD